MHAVKKSKHGHKAPASSSAMVAAKRRASRRLTRLPGALVSTRSEIKAIDIPNANYGFTSVGTGPVANLLNGVQVGAAFTNRIGSRMEMKSIHMRGTITSTVTDVQNILRALLIYDRQPNGAAPVYTDVFQSRDQSGTAATTAISEINLDQRDRYVVVRDFQWSSPAVSNAAGVLTNGPEYAPGDNDWNLNEFIPLTGLTTHFKSSSAPTTIADINTGSLYMFFVTSGTSARWTFSGGFRLRFNDA